MFLILGSNGYLGNWTVKVLQKQGYNVVGANVRLENTNELLDVIKKSNCKYVICAAGISGKPTIDWCESNEITTFNTNVLGILNLIKICDELDIHVTIYGSGLVYTGIKKLYKEDDIPDFTQKVYSKYRILLEQILRTSPYKNWLYLRIIFPCTFDSNTKCFYNKLKDKPYLHDISVPLTIVPYMFEFIDKLLLRNTIGIYNFVNTGTVHLSKLNASADIRKPDVNARGAYELDTTKLSKQLKVEIMDVNMCLKLNLKNLQSDK